MTNKKIVIAGGSGFIGNELIRYCRSTDQLSRRRENCRYSKKTARKSSKAGLSRGDLRGSHPSMRELAVIVERPCVKTNNLKKTKLTTKEILGFHYKGFAKNANWESVIADDFE